MSNASSAETVHPHRDTANATSGLVRLVDVGLIATLVVVPLAMGGRFAWGNLILVCLASLTAATWCIVQVVQRQRWQYSGAEWLILASLGLLALQVTPLPASVLKMLSPSSERLLPIWNSDVGTALGVDGWSTVSMTPELTRSSAAVFLSYCLIFLTTVERVRRLGDVERLLKAVVVSAAIMAAFGLAQFFFGNGKFFWTYDHPLSDTWHYAKGSFTNRNHFAHFLALALGPCIWWLLQSASTQSTKSESSFGRANGRGQGMSGILGVVLITLLMGILLSLSRGGLIAAAAGLAVCLVLNFRAGLLKARTLGVVGGVAAALAVLLLGYGEERVQERLDDIVSADVERLDHANANGRLDIWKADMEAIPDFTVLGAGVGSHRFIYKTYMEKPHAAEFSHAESGYIQLPLEAGFSGLGLALLGIGLLAYWCFRASRSRQTPVVMCVAAVSSSLVVSVTHSVVDFVWYVPGCMVFVAVLAGCACRLWQIIRLHRQQPTLTVPIPRPAWVLALVGIAVFCYSVVPQQIQACAGERHWHEFVRLNNAEAENPSDDKLASFKRRVEALSNAVKSDPNNPRTQIRMARSYLRLFELVQDRSDNPMSLSQFRDAAIASREHFETVDDLNEWLDRAIGKNRRYLDAAEQHTKAALELCPLLGQGYTYLGELAFLHGVADGAEESLVSQAILVRPFEPEVLFAAGKFSWSKGDAETALSHWKNVFKRNEIFRRRIIRVLTPYVSAEFFLKEFQPEQAGLGELVEQYELAARLKDARLLRGHYAKATVELAKTETGEEAVELWIAAHEAFAGLEQPDRERKCLELALKASPSSFQARETLAVWLYRHQEFDAALEHLKWCLLRKPRDPRLVEWTEVASKESRRAPQTAGRTTSDAL